MCGIAGFIGKKQIDEDKIHKTLELMKKRGPDHQGVSKLKFKDLNIYLLNSRLSIIDLDPRSNPPMKVEDTTLAYNGEIYNYIEVRENLKKRGAIFNTDSDTEVLLRALIQGGTSALNTLEGMWAFAQFDEKKGQLTLSRDRFGEKPLYYFQDSEGLYFGSEVKFLTSLRGQKFSVNNNQVLRYLINGYKSLYKSGETYFKDLKELPAGHNLSVTSNLETTLTRYWKPEYKPVNMSLENAIAGARERLFESVKIRLRSDVPLAFCLSGGIDSSALTSIASKIFSVDVSTYSIIDSDPRYNERENIQATVNDLGCKNHVINLEKENSFDRMRRVVAYHDSPIATITYYVHNYLSEAISRAGCKVAFSGTSADELFTGYYDHFNLHLYEMRNRDDFQDYLQDWKKNISGFVRNPHLKNPELYFNNPDSRSHVYLNNDEFEKYLRVPFHEEFSELKFTDSLLRNRMMNELFAEATPVILHEDDLNSMMYSVENRSPFLDSRLFDFCYSIPPEHLIKNGYGKYLLREAVKVVLNDKVRLDRQKKGFNASINSIVNFDHKQLKEDLLSPGPIYDIVDRDKISKLFKGDELPNSFSKFLFSFINAKIFLELNQ
jgi:asparagine synthase (glutamine-hydrolysing)